MTIGIIPGWLLAVVIAVCVGGFPVDISLAVAAIGIGLSLAAVSRSSAALSPVIAPLAVLMSRYVLLPEFSTGMSADLAKYVHFMQMLSSPTALIVISFLSIFGSFIAGFAWAIRGSR